MCKATLGLELEYSDFKVMLYVGKEEGKIAEEDFKSKHIIIVDGDPDAEALFSELGAYGIRVTLDTRSQHDELSGEIPLTIELVLEHDKFQINNDECLGTEKISLSQTFSRDVEKFSQYIMNESRGETMLKIQFAGNDKTYELKIPAYNGRGELMPHVTIPCPLYRIGTPEKAAPYEWEGANGNKMPEYSLDYLLRILESLKAVVKLETRDLTPEECKEIEKHDPKQNYSVIPKTSFNAIFTIVRNFIHDYQIIDTEKSDYYITPSITYKELIGSINSEGADLLKDNLIGIGSIGPKLEKVGNEECPIFEFRNVRSFKADKIEAFEQMLMDDLVQLYKGNRTPFYFTGVRD